jgi:hypothetical protein
LIDSAIDGAGLDPDDVGHFAAVGGGGPGDVGWKGGVFGQRLHRQRFDAGGAALRTVHISHHRIHRTVSVERRSEDRSVRELELFGFADERLLVRA